MVHDVQTLFDAIEAGDVDGVRRIVAEDEALARARDAEGVSALMRSLYCFDEPVSQALLGREPELDVFEAVSFGEVDPLADMLGADPGSRRHSPRTVSPPCTSRRSLAAPTRRGSSSFAGRTWTLVDAAG